MPASRRGHYLSATVRRPRHRHIVGAAQSALWPIRFRSSAEVSPRVAASRSLEATWARAPVSYLETFSQTSFRTARSSAGVSLSNIGEIPPAAPSRDCRKARHGKKARRVPQCKHVNRAEKLDSATQRTALAEG